jgi:hypothetical protein
MIRPRPGKLDDLDNHDFPPIEAARQVKTVFSLTCELVPNF